jgi:iron complex outermembrane receptor protein
MHSWSKKVALSGGVATFALIAATAAYAQVKSFDVPSEDAVRAIPEFARQAGIQILVPADVLKGVKTPAIKGELDTHAALHELLAGTGVVVASDDGQTIALAVPQKNVEAAQSEGAAQRDTADTVETVTVTADKQVETTMNVPMGLTALSGEQLQREQSNRLEDYVGKVPGLTLINFNGLGSQLVIRGLSSGSVPTNSGVATYIDETPFYDRGSVRRGLYLPAEP